MQVPYEFPGPWPVETSSFDESQAFQYGVITMSRNGYQGLRGALSTFRRFASYAGSLCGGASTATCGA